MTDHGPQKQPASDMRIEAQVRQARRELAEARKQEPVDYELSSMDPQMAWDWIEWTDDLSPVQQNDLARVLAAVWRGGQRDMSPPTKGR